MSDRRQFADQYIKADLLLETVSTKPAKSIGLISPVFSSQVSIFLETRLLFPGVGSALFLPVYTSTFT